MESLDDDIYILSNHDTVDGGSGSINAQLVAENFNISRSSRVQNTDPPVQALLQAYADLKKRYNQSSIRNQSMSRALRGVGQFRMGEAEEMVSMNAHGAAATSEPISGDENQRAQQGYIRYLEREKVNQDAKLQQMSSFEDHVKAMQVKLKSTVEDLRLKEGDLNKAHAMIKKLKEANMQLQDDHEILRKHTCDSQDHMHSSLQSSLEKQSREMSELRVKYVDLEVQYNRVAEECDRLKVSEDVAQNELQASRDRLDDLQHSHRALGVRNRELEGRNRALEGRVQELEGQVLKEPDLSVVVSSPTAQEMVHLKKVTADLHRTVLQQKEFLSGMGVSGGQMVLPGGGQMVLPSGGQMVLPGGGQMVLPGGGQMVLGKNTLPHGDCRLGQSWETVASSPLVSSAGGMVVKDGLHPSPRRNLVPAVPANADLSGPLLPTSNLWNLAPASGRKSSSTSDSPSPSPAVRNHSQSEVLRRKKDLTMGSSRNKSEVLARASHVHGNRRELSPLDEPAWQKQTIHNAGHGIDRTTRFQSSYDNSNPVASDIDETRGRTLRVEQDEYTDLQDNTPAFPVPSRPSPEHAPPREIAASSQGHVSAGSSEKVCPVCSRDFSPMPMSDFQTHVFECFDDQSAPETIRASAPNERICPMCNSLFSENVSQEEFEKHVQTHFENDIDRFEILNP